MLLVGKWEAIGWKKIVRWVRWKIKMHIGFFFIIYPEHECVCVFVVAMHRYTISLRLNCTRISSAPKFPNAVYNELFSRCRSRCRCCFASQSLYYHTHTHTHTRVNNSWRWCSRPKTCIYSPIFSSKKKRSYPFHLYNCVAKKPIHALSTRTHRY